MTSHDNNPRTGNHTLLYSHNCGRIVCWTAILRGVLKVVAHIFQSNVSPGQNETYQHQIVDATEPSAMNIFQWYAAAITFVAVCCLLLRAFHQLAEVGEQVSQAIAKQLLYRHIIGRHALIGPWTLAFGLAQMAFLGVNMFCICFKASDLSQIGDRGGILALMNLSLLMMAFQFDRVTHALGFSLTTSRKIHRSMGWNAFLLAAIHVVIAAVKDRSIWSLLPQHPFWITVWHSNMFSYC